MKSIKHISKIFPLAILVLAGFFLANQQKVAPDNSSQSSPSLQLTTLLDPANLNLESKAKASWFQNIIPTAQAAPPFTSADPRKLTIYGGVITVVNGTATTTDALEIGQAVSSGLGLASTNDIYFSPDKTASAYRAYFAGWKEAAPSVKEHVLLHLTGALEVQDGGAGGDTMYIGNAGRDIRSTGRIYIVPQSSAAASNFWGSGSAQNLILTGELELGVQTDWPQLSIKNNYVGGTMMEFGFPAADTFLFKKNNNTGKIAFRKLENSFDMVTIDVANSRLSVNNIDSTGNYAKLTVNNPNTSAKVGSSGDAIYAYADSGNAAISGEQGGAGYAGYFSANNINPAFKVTQLGATGWGGYFIGKSYISKPWKAGEHEAGRGANEFDTYASLVVRNKTSGDITDALSSGSTGSAIYAVANSADAAFTARQVGAGTAGQFFGRVDISGGDLYVGSVASPRSICLNGAANCISSWPSGGGVGGGGTLNYIPKFSPNGTTLANSVIYENVIGGISKIGIGQNSPAAKFVVNNPTTPLKVGLPEDAIYAYANTNSINGLAAAIHAEQAGSDYAGYFSGRVKIEGAFTPLYVEATDNDIAAQFIKGVVNIGIPGNQAQPLLGGNVGALSIYSWNGTGLFVDSGSADGSDHAAEFMGDVDIVGNLKIQAPNMGGSWTDAALVASLTGGSDRCDTSCTAQGRTCFMAMGWSGLNQIYFACYVNCAGSGYSGCKCLCY